MMGDGSDGFNEMSSKWWAVVVFLMKCPVNDGRW